MVILIEYRIKNILSCFDELSIDGFDFTNGFECSDVHNFEKLAVSSINIFELSFFEGQNEWKHKLIPIEVSKSISDKVFDLLTYKNLYVLIEKLHVFLGKHDSKFACRRYLSSYSSQMFQN